MFENMKSSSLHEQNGLLKAISENKEKINSNSVDELSSIGYFKDILKLYLN